MKKISTLLFVLAFFGGINSAIAQMPTPLYAGYRNAATIDEIDTTGGTFTVVGSTSVTSDFGPVNGIFGLSTDPTDEQMYILYQSSGGATSRRLGTYDPESGSITDIGNSGNMTDLAFDGDGNLRATGGWSGTTDMDVWTVDKVTGSPSLEFVSATSNWGSSIAYNPFADEYLMLQAGSGYSSIDPVTMVETTLSGSTPTDVSSMVVMDDNLIWFFSDANLYSFNITSGSYTYVGSFSQYHALGFGPLPCNTLTIDVTATELCEGEDVTLDATSETGGTITWTGGVTDEVPFAPGPPGVYEYIPMSDSEDDCEVTEPVTVEVIGLPTVIAGAGDLNFCEDEMITLSTAGDADAYEWNDGEELDLMPGPGEYTFSLFGEYTEGGCLGENTDEVTVTVHALPTISASASDEMICIGNSVTLSGEGGATYEWDMGVMDGVEFSPNTIGTTTYTVTGWDEFGCEGMATIDVEVVEDITISLNSITLETEGDDAMIDIEVSGGAPTYTFDWDNDGTGDFDDDEDLSGVHDGFYTVVVMGAAGCETSALYEVGSQLSIDENDAAVSVYPNPTTDVIQIMFSGNFQYELVSINGEILVSGTAVDQEELSLEKFADGIYFINVLSGEHTSTVKVIKK